MKTLKTNRLILRKFKLSDSGDMFDYAKRLDVGPLAGWKPHGNEEESLTIIKDFIGKNEVFAIEYKQNGKMIGSVGIHSTLLGDFGAVFELGYVLHPDYHRQGIMSEAIHCILDYFFVNLNNDEIYVGHFKENLASKKLIMKLGFEYIEDILYQSRDYGKKDTRIYRLTKLNYALSRERE